MSKVSVLFSDWAIGIWFHESESFHITHSSGLDVSFRTTSDLFLHLLDLGVSCDMASLKWKAMTFLTCALVNSRGQSFMTPNPPPKKKTKEQSEQSSHWFKTSVTKSNGRNNSSRIDIRHNMHHSCDSQLHSKKTVSTNAILTST